MRINKVCFCDVRASTSQRCSGAWRQPRRRAGYVQPPTQSFLSGDIWMTHFSAYATPTPPTPPPRLAASTANPSHTLERRTDLLGYRQTKLRQREPTLETLLGSSRPPIPPHVRLCSQCVRGTF
ncbi:hypothetical protein SKAU_G00041440 [Synaphobranchus kaupii]|uniref:Uncharacterized protein n=1 Tax=Synaphobranchus kaupii TaxID=118154 RepID=A0A9Q1G194_SYNKA|nr:hypothetical protein SKAU_G00041440 [Synaphobranchus kaupii]